MRVIIAIFSCVTFFSSFAQEVTIEPDVNKKGKYALTSVSPDSKKREIILDYEYDFISKANLIPDNNGPGRSPFFVVNKAGVWGAVNGKGEYVFNAIEADTMWLLRSKDAYKVRYEDRSYDYVSITGKTIASDIVDEKRSPYARYRILIKKDGTQSIIHRGKEVVKPIPYELDLDIQNRARTFLVKNKQGYYVINLDGFPLNDKPFEAATRIDFDGNLAVQRNGEWSVVDKDLKPVDNRKYSRVEHRESRFGQQSFYLCYEKGQEHPYVYTGEYPKLVSEKPIEGFRVMRAFGVGRQDGKWGYVGPNTDEFKDVRYDEIGHSEKGHFYFHILFGKIGSSYCLMNEDGEVFYESMGIEKVSTIRCEQGARILLHKGGKIAMVYEPEKEPNPEFIYTEAEGSDKGFYLLKDGMWGMIDATGKVVAEFKYKKKEDIQP